MIIFLYGPDTYRSRKKLNEIIEHYRKIHKSGLNLKFFEEENLDFQDFQNALDPTPMFKEKKLLVLKNVFSEQQFKKEFLKQKKRFAKADDIILIYEKKEISENDQLFQFLKKNSKSQEFRLLKDEKLKNWVKKEFLKYKAEIEPIALEKLIEFAGNNLWSLSNEIKKSVNYTKREKVKTRDIELLVRPKIEIDIFKTIDALAEKKKNLALNLIHKHLEKGDNPLYLLSMINFQFRNLLIVKSHELGRELYANDTRIVNKKLKMHPYVIKKTTQQAKRFSFEELKKIYQKIFQADLNIKTGRAEPETALDMLIAEI